VRCLKQAKALQTESGLLQPQTPEESLPEATPTAKRFKVLSYCESYSILLKKISKHV
jgi:hypothetical protein